MSVPHSFAKLARGCERRSFRDDKNMIEILLASASPRRRSLLESATLDGVPLSVRVAVPAIDESAHPEEPPRTLVERLAREKNLAVQASSSEFVVSGDTIVVLGDRILGKPQDANDAIETLKSLSGTEHAVISGWCVRRDSQLLSGIEETTVRFRNLTSTEIEDYVATGEPLDKAGSYGIQEQGGRFVEEVLGSVENVVGLPVIPVLSAIRTVGGLPSRSGD